MHHARSWALALLVVALALAGAACEGPVATKPADIERAVRLAQADSANVLVVMESSGKYRAFDATAVGTVSGNRITLRKGSYGFFDVQGNGTPAKIAAALVDRWTPPPDVRGNYAMTGDPSASVTISFHYGTLAAETTVDIKALVLVGRKR
jgi:hypothetical protein